jgi:hypothetical protein
MRRSDQVVEETTDLVSRHNLNAVGSLMTISWWTGSAPSHAEGLVRRGVKFDWSTGVHHPVIRPTVEELPLRRPASRRCRRAPTPDPRR